MAAKEKSRLTNALDHRDAQSVDTPAPTGNAVGAEIPSLTKEQGL
jgi:hypothetical protein